MGYFEVSQMSTDENLSARVRVCAVQERPDVEPYQWTSNNMMRVCSTPGWDEAWTSAEADGVVAIPGRDQAVITDQQILAAVLPLIAAEPQRRT